MNHFIGLDGHKNSCTFVVLNEKGKLKRKTVLPTEEKALVEFLKTIPGRRHLCIEEGTQSQWFHEIFSGLVHDLAIVQGRKTPGNKDDERDARHLAERFRIRDLGPRIHKVPDSLLTLKDLVRSYEMINTDLVRVKNRIKHLYRSRGVAYAKEGCPFCTPRGGCKKPGFHHLLKLLRTEQEHLEPLKADAQKAMVAEAKTHPITRILQTAPGFGPVRSAQLLSIVITPYRFRTSRQFWCYCGLAIVRRSSADWVQKPNGQWVWASSNQTRGLNRNFNRMAKAIFKGAAMTVVTSKNTERPLRQDYERLLANGTKPNLARLTLARKIAATVLAMWKNKEAYDPGKYRLNNR
jgi:transposase